MRIWQKEKRNKPVVSKVVLVPVDQIFGGEAPDSPALPEKPVGPEKSLPSSTMSPSKFLMDSIAKEGILSPLVLHASPTGDFSLVAGGKRLQAARALGLKAVPAMVFSLSESKARILSAWHPGLLVNDPIMLSRNQSILAAAEKRGLVTGEEMGELEKLSEDALLEALKKRCQEKAGPAAESEPEAAAKSEAAVEPEAPEASQAPETPEPESSEPESSEYVSENNDAEENNPGNNRPEEGRQIDDAVSQAIRKVVSEDGGNQKALDRFKQFFETVAARGRINGVDAERVVQFFIKLRQNDPHNFMFWGGQAGQAAVGLNTVEKHSLLVMKMCIQLAFSLGWSRLQVMRFGVAGLLHDIGLVAKEWQPQAGTDDPVEEPHEHCEAGAALVADAKAWGDQIPAVCRDHHERWDGSGYPEGKKGDAVDLPGRLLGLIDTFAQWVQPLGQTLGQTGESPQQAGISPHDAMGKLSEMTDDGRFDPDVFQVFLAHFSAWPVGSILRLQDGKITQVVGPNTRKPASPRLKILVPEDKNKRFMELGGAGEVAEDLSLAAMENM